MNFYDVFTTWQAFKKITKEREPWDFWYDYQIRNSFLKKSVDGNFTPSNLQLEQSWLQQGRPYYKIWPGVFDQFISTRLDLSTEFLKPAHKAFAIRFPICEEPLIDFEATENRHFCVGTVLAEYFSAKDIEFAMDNFGEVSTPLSQIFPHSLDIPNRSMLKVRISLENLSPDYDEYNNPMEKEIASIINPPALFFRNIEIKPNTSIEDTIGEFVDTQAENDPTHSTPASVIEACFRLLVGVCFVSTGSHKALEYDVLSKHLEAYRQLREEHPKKKEYETKAKKRGKYGWNIGRDKTDRWLRLPRGTTYDQASKDAGGRHLLYRHIRGGHWHIVKYGPKRQKNKLMWFDETVVRPDLPIKK